MHPCGKNEDAYTLVPQAPAIGVPAPKQIEFQEPTPPLPQEMDTQGWSTGLCSCFDDVGLCFLTWCCPCVTFGRIAEIVDRGSTCDPMIEVVVSLLRPTNWSACGTSGATYAILRYMTGCSCLLGSYYRTRLRRDYSLQKGTCPNFVVHCCCELCALCQEHRELKNRGFNMALGWHANVKMSSEGLMQPPPVAESMRR
ncbi:unnamed protein product [Spirodela intermedia]|uniref:Uncharacterized protein n=1 Tax=Spirodela intermedia TaxID=51605 RepID=A0A7I8KSP3_SPIIN|nr:unnamed protein product [Spirodela intermedia]